MENGKHTLISDDTSLAIIQTAERLALSEGAGRLSVRMILREMEITNRVFYNRFHNIEEVLAIVYRNTALKIRESIISKFDPDGDYFEQILEIVTNTLVISYEKKMHLNQYVFEIDSLSEENYRWWKSEIQQLIELGKQKKVIRDVDADALSYAIWCFIRGYNADALGRGIPREEALRNFRYSFGVLLDGMRRTPSDDRD